MRYKLFVISDVHGYFEEMKRALHDAGFCPENPEHLLVSLGDNIDRGPYPVETLEYLLSLPRKVLVKGNHEFLFTEYYERGFPQFHDYQNGTHQTFRQLKELERRQKEPTLMEDKCSAYYHLFKENMAHYFETKHYIFVHAFLPIHTEKGTKIIQKDWRKASTFRWEDATWEDPYQAVESVKLPTKTIVFGHRGTNLQRARKLNIPAFYDEADFSIYRGEGYIGIDACTAFSHQVNCLVLEDELLAPLP